MVVKAMILVLFVNYVADQFVQIKQVKYIKHDSAIAMLMHVMTWFMPMMVLTIYHITSVQSLEPLKYLMVLTVTHYVVDLVTSYAYKYFIRKNDSVNAVGMIILNTVIMNCVLIKLVHSCVYVC